MQLNNDMIWDAKKNIIYSISLLFAVGPLLCAGCGILNPPKIENGYFIDHYRSCGPAAVDKALSQYITTLRTRKQISQDIQDNGNFYRHLASIVHKQGAQITCPSEIVEICKQYGFSVTTVDQLDTLDPETDVALVLVRKSLGEWHWLCFPVDSSIADWYGDDTTVRVIYLLKPLNR